MSEDNVVSFNEYFRIDSELNNSSTIHNKIENGDNFFAMSIGEHKEVGRIFYEDDVVKFEGDVDKSAEIFFNEIVRRLNQWMGDK